MGTTVVTRCQTWLWMFIYFRSFVPYPFRDWF